MKYKFLGSTGIQVSGFSFGTMSFGGDADRAMSQKMYRMCRDKGINLFDCANVYQNGQSEIILGECIKGHRDEIILTSKAGGKMAESLNYRGASRKNLRLSLEASLKRLGTDYLDIYFIHFFDKNTALEETMYTLDTFIREGKILHAGASNFAAWQIMKAQNIARLAGQTPFSCLQPMYNLLKRQAEVEILPMALSENLGVISYSPMAGGMLSGKYRIPENRGRLLENKTYEKRYGDSAYGRITEDFCLLAKRYNYSPAALAVAWAGSQPGVTAPILGARNTDQLKMVLDAADIVMTEELRNEISAVSTDPPPATDRSEEI